MNRLRALGLLLAAAVTAQESEIQIFSPANESVVEGEVRIVAAGKGKLLLDGQPIEAKSPAAGVLHASAKVAAGAHELSIEGGPSVRFHSGAGAPAGWKPFRAHPPGGAACETCHAVKNGVWTFARASLTGVCFACHDREKFPKTHTHEPGIIPDCQLCHSPHGSTTAFHLKMNKETACKQCHN